MDLKASKKLMILIASVGILLLARFTRFTPWPEMLLWPYLLNRGWFPYHDFAIIHSPLLPIILASWFKIAGTGVVQLKLFSWFLIGLCAILVAVVGRKKFILPAIPTGLAYGILVLRYEGNGVWFDLGLVPFILLLFYFLHVRKFFLAGLCWGVALATKQTAIWFAVPVILTLIGPAFVRNVMSLGGGVAAIIIPWWLVMYVMGIFPDYWYWSVKFGVFTMPRMSGHTHPGVFQFVSGMLPWALFGFLPWMKMYRRETLLILSWSMAGLMGLFPRWELFHFQPALPFLIMGTFIVWSGISPKQRIILLLLGAIFIVNSFRYFSNVFGQPDRFMEVEFLTAAALVRQTTAVSDRIFVLNWWDHLYVLADRLPPKPWIPQLSWYMTQPEVQSQAIAGLARTTPKLVIARPHDQTGLGAYKAQDLEAYLFGRFRVETAGPSYSILVPDTYVP